MSNTTQNFDAVIIGGGHNGLTAATTLARKGHSVCVLERSSVLGGMMSVGGAEAPSFTSRLAHLLYNLNPKVERELGLRLNARNLTTVSLAPNGEHVEIDGGKARMMDGALHPKAVAFATLQTRLQRFATLLSRLSLRTPPKLSGSWTDPETFGELMGLAGIGLGLKGMGKVEMREFLRALLTNVHDLMVDDLDDGPLAGAMAADAVRGSFSGPKAPGTLFSLLYRLGNGANLRAPVGGMASAVAAFEDAAARAGCVIKRQSAVRSVLVQGDRVHGVELDDGTVIHAKAVLSSIGPQATINLAGIQHFDVEIARRAKNLRAKGTAGKLNLLLKARPEFSGLPAPLHQARLLIAPSSDYVEHAFNPVKYGSFSEAPTLEILLPNAHTPETPQTLSAVVGYMPHDPPGGWTDALRTKAERQIMAVLEAYAPGIGDRVQHSELLTPTDIQTETGAAGGHWHHGEMGIDQILNVRPINGMAHYQCRVEGLYLCGASAHPGGDINGAPGRNSALQALKDGAL